MVLTPLHLKTCIIFGCTFLNEKEEVFNIDWFHLAQHLTSLNCKGHIWSLLNLVGKKLFFL